MLDGVRLPAVEDAGCQRAGVRRWGRTRPGRWTARNRTHTAVRVGGGELKRRGAEARRGGEKAEGRREGEREGRRDRATEGRSEGATEGKSGRNAEAWVKTDGRSEPGGRAAGGLWKTGNHRCTRMNTDDRSEPGGQAAGATGGKDEGRRQEKEDRRQESEDRSQKTGVRRQESEVRSQESEDRSRGPGAWDSTACRHPRHEGSPSCSLIPQTGCVAVRTPNSR